MPRRGGPNRKRQVATNVPGFASRTLERVIPAKAGTQKQCLRNFFTVLGPGSLPAKAGITRRPG